MLHKLERFSNLALNHYIQCLTNNSGGLFWLRQVKVAFISKFDVSSTCVLICFVSEVELVLGHLLVLGLAELVTQSLYEFRVDLEGELLHLSDGRRQVLLGIVRIFLHILVPAVAVFQLLCREDH